MIVDLSAWGHVRVTGSDQIRFLQGLTTANVAALAPGGHTWGAILNPKGRVLSVIRATRGDDHVVIHCEPALIDKTRGLLDRYAVMDDVAFELLATPAYTEWTGPAQAWEAPIVLAALPGPAASADDVEIARVEAGILRYGVDVDEDTFPFETPLGRFLDYEKGCYIGQEPVFRVHARGQAARALRGLRLRGDAAPAIGAKVVHPARPDAGAITSAALSPRLGPIALAYLHRTAWDLGAEVQVDGVPATIVEIPFAP